MKFSSILLILALTSCSAVRIRYEADVKTQNGDVYEYKYRKSFSVLPHSIACGLTFWYYGGWCWYFALLPTSGQQEDARWSGLKLLDKQFGKDKYEILDEDTYRSSYLEKRPQHDLVLVKKAGAPPPVAAPSPREGTGSTQYYDEDDYAEAAKPFEPFAGSRFQFETGGQSQFASSLHFAAAFGTDHVGIQLATEGGNEPAIIGVPLRIGFFYEGSLAPRIGLRFGGGWTQFKGAGTRGIVYSKGIGDTRYEDVEGAACRGTSVRCRNNVELVRDARWDLQFLDVRARATIYTGNALVMFAEVTRMLPYHFSLKVDGKAGDERFGEPVGIGSNYTSYKQGLYQSGIGFSGELLRERSASTGVLIGAGLWFPVQSNQ